MKNVLAGIAGAASAGVGNARLLDPAYVCYVSWFREKLIIDSAET